MSTTTPWHHGPVVYRDEADSVPMAVATSEAHAAEIVLALAAREESARLRDVAQAARDVARDHDTGVPMAAQWAALADAPAAPVIDLAARRR